MKLPLNRKIKLNVVRLSLGYRYISITFVLYNIANCRLLMHNCINIWKLFLALGLSLNISVLISFGYKLKCVRFLVEEKKYICWGAFKQKCWIQHDLCKTVVRITKFMIFFNDRLKKFTISLSEQMMKFVIFLSEGMMKFTIFLGFWLLKCDVFFSKGMTKLTFFSVRLMKLMIFSSKGIMKLAIFHSIRLMKFNLSYRLIDIICDPFIELNWEI